MKTRGRINWGRKENIGRCVYWSMSGGEPSKIMQALKKPVKKEVLKHWLYCRKIGGPNETGEK